SAQGPSVSIVGGAPDPFVSANRRRAFRLGGSLVRATARMELDGCEQLVQELDRDRAFTDCRRNALYRSVAHVAGGEHTGHARLEQERTPIERPRIRDAKVGAR